MSSYQDLMLKATKSLFEKNRYNDDIEYLKTDDFNYKSGIKCPGTVVNIRTEKIAEEDLEFIKEFIDYEKADLSHLTGTVEEIEMEVNSSFLSKFENVAVNENDRDDKETAIKLAQASYDGVRYYCKTNLLVIPQCIKSYVAKGGNPNLTCKISVYNYKYCNEEKRKVFNCQDIKTPTLKFTAIPKKLAYVKIKEPKYKIIDGDTKVLYTNLPTEYYRQICVDNETLAYNINKECFIGHSNSNETKINHLCYDIAVNGFQKVIQLKLLDGGKLVPYFSNKRVLIGEYLNLPSIPVAVILDSHSYSKDLLYFESGDVKDLANKYLNPYFLF